jgi:glutamyl-tRNA reductase
VTVVNRTRATAERLAERHGAHVGALDDLAALIADADLVVAAAGAGRTLISADHVLPRTRPLAIVDLGLPPDTDPGLGEVDGVVRVDLQTLHEVSASFADSDDVAAAREIVRAEVAVFVSDHAARGVEPTLVALRAMAADVVSAETARLRTRLPDLTAEQFADVESSVRRAVSALLHTPTVRIKEYAVGPEGSVYAEALRALFDLDPSAIAAIERGTDVPKG